MAPVKLSATIQPIIFPDEQVHPAKPTSVVQEVTAHPARPTAVVQKVIAHPVKVQVPPSVIPTKIARPYREIPNQVQRVQLNPAQINEVQYKLWVLFQLSQKQRHELIFGMRQGKFVFFEYDNYFSQKVYDILALREEYEAWKKMGILYPSLIPFANNYNLIFSNGYLLDAHNCARNSFQKSFLNNYYSQYVKMRASFNGHFRQPFKLPFHPVPGPPCSFF